MPSSIVAVFQPPDRNALAIADGIQTTIENLKTRLPRRCRVRYSLDTTRPVTEGIREIVKTLAEAMVLVILVRVLVLQNWRGHADSDGCGAGLAHRDVRGLPHARVLDQYAVAIRPGTSRWGSSSTMRLWSSRRFEHHIEQGMSPKDATLLAMREVSGPVVSIAL